MISDIHGNYNAYMDMLKKIQFDDDDILYILGDILDRGPNPIQIILDVMKRPNVEVLAGNHCVMALECLSFLLKEITLILSILVDTFISKISFPMQPGPEIGSISDA